MQRFPCSRPALLSDLSHRCLAHHRFALGVLLCAWLVLAAPGVRAGERNILVLGDSISAGYGMSLQQGWVALLAGHLAEAHPGWNVVNASISGETSAGGLRRLPDLLAEHAPELLLVELGANDGLRGYPPQRLRANLQEIVTLAQAAGATVVLLPMEIPPNYGARYTRAFRDSYRQVAKENAASLAPFLLDGFATDPEFMQVDGIHPTAAAQPLILDNVLPTILQELTTP